MPEYKCECCNYDTKIKTHFQRHLNSKKHKRLNKNVKPEKNDLHISPHFPHFLHISPHFLTFFHIFHIFSTKKN